MEPDQPGFWATLAANDEFWKQFPYWITGLTAIVGSLAGAWVGARLNHSTGLAREREARRRRNLERVAEIASSILSTAISYQSTAKSLSKAMSNYRGIMADHPQEVGRFVSRQQELERETRRVIEANSLLGMTNEAKVRDAFRELHEASSHLQQVADELESITPDDIESRVIALTEKYNAVMVNIRAAWNIDRE